MSKVDVNRPENWTIYFDEETQQPYYWNEVTDETTWDQPPGVAKAPPPPLHTPPGKQADSKAFLSVPLDHEGKLAHRKQTRRCFQASRDFHKSMDQRSLKPDYVKCAITTCWKEAKNSDLCLKHFFEAACYDSSRPSVSYKQVESFNQLDTCEEDAALAYEHVQAHEFPDETKQDGASNQEMLVRELVNTETSYLEGLNAVYRSFQRRLEVMAEIGCPLLSKEVVMDIFHNFAEIRDLHQRMHAELTALQASEALLTEQLGRALCSYVPFFKLYKIYAAGYESGMKTLISWRQKSQQVSEFFEVGEKVEGFSIEALLITPVQRLPRYLLLLKGILKHTEATQSAFEAALVEALEKISAVTEEVNTSLKLQEARDRVVQIQNQIEERINLVTPTRYHIRDGPLRKKFNNKWKIKDDKKYWFFLFNDLLIYTTMPSAGGKCSVKHSLELATMTVEDVADNDKDKITHAFEITGKPKSFIVCANSDEDKELWMRDLKQTIQELTDKRSTFFRHGTT